MRWALVLIVAAVVVASAFLLREKRPPRADPEPPPAWGGSDSCRECHPDIFDSWSKGAHANTLRDFAPGVSARPFDGDYFVARDIEHQLGPGAFMFCEGPGGEMRRFPVEMVIGLRRIQMFTTTMEDGRIQVLPVFLEVPAKRWFDYADFIFGGPSDLDIPPDSPNSWYTYARNFNSRCGRCHMTDYVIGYDPDSGTYDTRWRERRIGCESCHGRAGAHGAYWREGHTGRDPILNPAKLSVGRANQVCGQCHAEGEMIVPGYRPGDDLFAFVDVHGLEDEKHLLPDGRANELIHELIPTTESRCGPIACTKCHDPHGHEIPGMLYRPPGDDRACTQCHEETKPHSHHPPESEGSRCVHCHMPRMIIEGGHGRIFDHTISIPSLANTQRRGLPNACAECHAAEMPGWVAEHFEKWYPDADRRNHRVALAEAIEGGRRSRPEAEEALRKLLGHENPVYRAGAAWLLSRYGADLRPQLEDGHPMVRRAAIKGIVQSSPDALLPLLEDPSMVLRHAAAMALAETRRFAWVRENAAARARILATLETFASLRPDRARIHFTLGALYEIEGRRADAARAYARYLRINPWDEKVLARQRSLR